MNLIDIYLITFNVRLRKRVELILQMIVIVKKAIKKAVLNMKQLLHPNQCRSCLYLSIGKIIYWSFNI